jgi:hypothetical protein
VLNQLQQDYAALDQRVRLLEAAVYPLETLQAEYAELASRVDALEGSPPPAPTGRIKATDLELVGGWILMQDYARPGLAIDFENTRAFSGVHAHQTGINEYQLPEMGSGEIANWPRVSKSVVHPQFWEQFHNNIQPHGLSYENGVLSVSPRAWYYFSDVNPHIVAHKNLSTGEITTTSVPVSTQQYGGGFIKGHPDGLMLGCGGYLSGGSSFAGPTAAKMDGTPLLSQPHFTIVDFDSREKRPPTAWPQNGVDDYIAFNPRDGVSAWGADMVDGGGIWTDRGVLYWPSLGTGEGWYGNSRINFSEGWKTWLYSYDPESWDKPEWSQWDYGKVVGCDVSGDLLYVLIADAIRIGDLFNAVAVFRIKG